MADGLEVSQSRLPEHVIGENHKESYVYPQSEQQEAFPNHREERAPRSKRIWLIVLAVAVTAVVVGTAIGGGVGRQIHGGSRSGSQQPELSTITLTTSITASAPVATASIGLRAAYAVPTLEQIDTVALDCPARDREQYTTSYEPLLRPRTFLITCDISLQGPDGAYLTSIVAFRLNDCIEACRNTTTMTTTPPRTRARRSRFMTGCTIMARRRR